MKYLKTYNESLRDKMTPKSEEEVANAYRRIINIVTTTIDGFPTDDYKEFQEVADLLKVDKKDLFLIIENDDNYDNIDEYFSSLVDFKDDSAIIINIEENDSRAGGKWYCFPEQKLAFWTAKDFDFMSAWIFCKDFILSENVNEGLSDKMTPKSEEEIISKIPKDLTPEEELEFGATHNIIWLIKKAIDSGVDIHYKNDTALRIACESGSYDIVKYLLENGADVHVDTDASIYHASYRDYTDIVKLLVEHGANINATGGSPIEFAIRHENLELVKLLVEKGVELRPELQYYINQSSDEIIAYLKK